jgi:hypothetical protein
MRLVRHLIFALIFWPASKVFAQLNESDTLQFQLRTSVTGNWQSGNVALLTVRGKLELVFRPSGTIVFKTQNSSLYQSFSGRKADNDIYSRNYLYYRPQRVLYPFAIAYLSANFRRKIKQRYFTGAGITWQLLNNGTDVIKLSGSLVYEGTSFFSKSFNLPSFDGSSKVEVWRGTAYIAGWHYILERRVRLYYDAFWQPQLSNRQNYRTQFDLGLDVPVWKGLAVVLNYSYTHENLVVLTVKQDDRIFTAGIACNFKEPLKKKKL